MDRYEVFLGQVKMGIQKKLGKDAQTEIATCWGNNGLKKDVLRIFKPDGKSVERVIPLIYLEPYFEKLQSGMTTMGEVSEDILRLLESGLPDDIDTDGDLGNYERVRGKIMFKVIHAAANDQLLKDIPHVRFLDLAVVFYLLLGQNETGQLVAPVYNACLREWGSNTEDLWEAAMVNTPRSLPAQIVPMKEMMAEIINGCMGDALDAEVAQFLLEGSEDESGMYVLSNRTGMYGAACMLYEGVLKAFSDSLGSDLLILPSSIHEALLIKDDGNRDYEECRAMVRGVNAEDVPLEDQLSDEVYRYIRETDEIVLAPGKTDGEP